MHRHSQRISFFKSSIATTLATAALLACASAQAENAAATLLRNALALAATSPGTNTIDLAPVAGQRIELDTPLVIDSDVVIEGRGVTLDGQLLSRVLQVNAGVTATVRQLTVTRGLLAGPGIAWNGTWQSGSSLGAGIHNAGHLTLDGVQVLGNYATGGGAGGGGAGGGGGGGGSGVRVPDGAGFLYGAGGAGGMGNPGVGGAGGVASPAGGGGMNTGGAGSNGGGAGGASSFSGGGGGGGGWAGGGGGSGTAGAGGGGYGGGGGGMSYAGGGSDGSSGGSKGGGDGAAGGAASAGGDASGTGGGRGGGGGYAMLGATWVGGGGGAGGGSGSNGGAAAGGIYNAPGASLALQGAGCSVTANLAAGGGGAGYRGGGRAVGGVWSDGTLTLAPECAAAIGGNAAGAGRNGQGGGFAPAAADGAWPLTVQAGAGVTVNASAAPIPLTGGIAACTSAGGANCSAIHAAGDVVTLTANAAPAGQQIVWSDGCVQDSGNPLRAIATMDTSRLCKAVLAASTYAITAVPAPMGGGTLDCPATAQHGTAAACTAHPATGYATQSISGCGGVPTGPGVDGYTTAALTGACTVTAQFALIDYAIAASASPGGAIACPATVPHGGSATCTATPEPGFRLDRFTGCDGVSGTDCQLTNVQAARAVAAVFMAVPAPAAIPTLSQWGVLLLSGLLGLAALRRRVTSQTGR